PVLESIPLATRLRSVVSALPILLVVLIIIGGLLGGVFTATEAGAIASLYAALLALITGRLNREVVADILRSSLVTTGIACALVAFAAVFSQLVTFLRVPCHAAEWIASISGSPVLFLILAMILYLILGAVMNPVAALSMAVPVLHPISTA